MQRLPRLGAPLEAGQSLREARPLALGIPGSGRSLRPYIADAATAHPICQEEPYNPGRDVSINPNKNSILTPQRPVPDVRLGYTSRVLSAFTKSDGEGRQEQAVERLEATKHAMGSLPPSGGC